MSIETQATDDLIHITSTVLRLTVDGVAVTLRLAGHAAQYLGASLAARFKASTLKSSGEVQLKALLKQGAPLNAVALERADAERFQTLAKEMGLLFNIKHDKVNYDGNFDIDGLSTIIFRQQDTQMVNSMLERLRTNSLAQASMEMVPVPPEAQQEEPVADWAADRDAESNTGENKEQLTADSKEILLERSTGEALEGTWSVVGTIEHVDKTLFVLESDSDGYTEQVGHVFVDADRRIYAENVHDVPMHPAQNRVEFYTVHLYNEQGESAVEVSDHALDKDEMAAMAAEHGFMGDTDVSVTRYYETVSGETQLTPDRKAEILQTIQSDRSLDDATILGRRHYTVNADHAPQREAQRTGQLDDMLSDMLSDMHPSHAGQDISL